MVCIVSRLLVVPFALAAILLVAAAPLGAQPAAKPAVLASRDIPLDEQALRAAGVSFLPIERERGATDLVFPGTVVVPPPQLLVVAAPVEGLIEAVEVASDEVVSAGQTIIRMCSPEIVQAQREFIAADANAMLGRAHELRGTVVTGDQRGRTIGFPTANVAVATDLCLPSEGIYAGGLRRADGTELDAAIYLGRRPTFYDDRAAMVLEVHCLDWSGDLYGEPVAVTFTDRLRGDQRFDSVDALATQLQLDCDDARRRRATRRG